jgi:hypothetical protein
MQSRSERGWTDQQTGNPRRTIILLEKDRIDSPHLVSVAIDDALVEQVADDVHVSLQKSRGE